MGKGVRRMTDNIKYHSYNNYKYIEIWYGDRDKGKFIISTVSEREADTVVNELNTWLSENIELEKENKELKDFKQQVINLINVAIEDLKKTNEVSLFPKDSIMVLERLKKVILNE